MSAGFIRAGTWTLNIESVAAGHWEGQLYFVHFRGGGFAKIGGNEAVLIAAAIGELAVDLSAAAVKGSGAKRSG